MSTLFDSTPLALKEVHPPKAKAKRTPEPPDPELVEKAASQLHQHVSVLVEEARQGISPLIRGAREPSKDLGVALERLLKSPSKESLTALLNTIEVTINRRARQDVEGKLAASPVLMDVMRMRP